MHFIGENMTLLATLPLVSTPDTHNRPFVQDVTELLHLVITMLEAKFLLTTYRNMWHFCSRYGWFFTYTRRRSVEGPGVSCVHGVHGATHKTVYKRPPHLQQVQRESPELSYMQSRVFRYQVFGSGKHRQKTQVPLR